MKKLQPYRSFDGANRSLDNGGRLWNVFTTAGDRVITKAEISAAGGGGGWAGALLFFEMMTSGLNAGEREELLHRLTPKLRRRWRQSGPELVSPNRLDSLDDTKRPYLLEGTTRSVEDKQLTTGYIPITTMVANVPMTTMMPVTEMFTVFEVTGSRGGKGRVLARKSAKLADGSRVRFGGTLRKGQEGKAKGSKARNFLNARFYVLLD
jgi:hypothetical protein